MSDPVQSPLFVGRREEIASLTVLLKRAADGEPGFAIVAGEVGGTVLAYALLVMRGTGETATVPVSQPAVAEAVPAR